MRFVVITHDKYEGKNNENAWLVEAPDRSTAISIVTAHPSHAEKMGLDSVQVFPIWQELWLQAEGEGKKL